MCLPIVPVFTSKASVSRRCYCDAWLYPPDSAAMVRQVKLDSIRSTRWHRRLPVAIWNPRQIATKHVDGQGRCHENCAYPEAPVTMHAPPIWTRIGSPCRHYFLPGCACFLSFRLHLPGIFAATRSLIAAGTMNQSFLGCRDVAWLPFPNLQGRLWMARANETPMPRASLT